MSEIRGSEYLSFLVRRLRPWKSTHKRREPSFFLTKSTGAPCGDSNGRAPEFAIRSYAFVTAQFFRTTRLSKKLAEKYLRAKLRVRPDDPLMLVPEGLGPSREEVRNIRQEVTGRKRKLGDTGASVQFS
jgi:hypothetical protein